MTTMTGEYRVRKKRQQPDMAMMQMPTSSIVTDRVIRRFLLRAGWLQCSPPMIEATQRYLHDFVTKIVDAMTVFMEYDRRMSLQVNDVLRACRFHGITIYGYDDMCEVPDPSGQYVGKQHVTEMLEARTIFSDPNDWDGNEPDTEPGSRYAKTNFVENYHLWCSQNGDDDDLDYDDDSDSEWSWYGESDIDSDEEHDSEMEEEEEQDTHMAESNQRLRRYLTASAEPSGRKVFLEALEEAQELVDDQLCYDEPEDEEIETVDAEEPFGQGYHSDFDEEYEPECMDDWNERANKEACIWEKQAARFAAKEDQLQAFLDAESCEEGMLYLIPRQTFYHLFRSIFRFTLPISAAALSALHNTTEQYLSHSVTQGSLKTQLMTMELEEYAQENHTLKTELEDERLKVTKKGQEIALLSKSFEAKQLEMQRQIQELQQQLLKFQQDQDRARQPVERSPLKKQLTPTGKSPGKRKAKAASYQVLEKQETQPANSLVGALRSRIQSLRSSKKARINPV